MSQYTPEYVDKWAGRMERNATHATALMPDDSFALAGIVRAYAATLRQAARVDEGMVARGLRGAEDASDARLPRYKVVRAILEAALSAQPAERQGEVVAWMGMQRNRLSCGPLGWTEADVRRCPTFDADTDVVVPLYFHPAAPVGVPDVKAMVDRFLGWRLPADFAPDCGISFKHEPDALGYAPTWPIGTNLLTAEQAEAMFEYVLAAPSAPQEVE